MMQLYYLYLGIDLGILDQTSNQVPQLDQEFEADRDAGKMDISMGKASRDLPLLSPLRDTRDPLEITTGSK